MADEPAKKPAPEPAPQPAEKDDPPPDMPSPVLDDELPKPPKLKKSPKGLVVVVIIAVVLLIAAAAGWFFFIRGDNSKPAQQQNQAQTEDQPAATDDVPEAPNTETFTSSPYRLTFQYPKTWEVTENNDNSLLVQSQNFTYKTVDGSSKNGNFRLYIRKGGQQADSDIIAKGVAIQDSAKLAYQNPTAAQRKETNLSLFGKDTENNFAFLLITGNYALKKGDTLGPNFGKEIETFIIGGGFSEPSLEPGLATNPVPVSGFQDTNAYRQAIAIIETFQIQ